VGSNLGSYIVSDKRKVIPKEVGSLAVWLEEYASSLFEIDIKNCLLPLNRIRSASVIQVRNRIKKDLTPDRNLIQSIDALDESYEILNLLSGRIVTWYSQTRGTHRIDIDSIIGKGLFPSGLNSLVKLFSIDSKLGLPSNKLHISFKDFRQDEIKISWFTKNKIRLTFFT